MYKLAFFVPETHVDVVKETMFTAGAGQIGNYQKCAWQTLGRGQFFAMDGSRPFLGAEGKLETVDEYKVEMVCKDELVVDAVAALKAAHPYEVPAYEVWRLEDF